ncbi:MAG: DUF3795 domain-containing protein [Ruminococcus sp.]|nr:DUF3795 domain-containing protein [Ruminococcus sp.]
MKNMITLCGDDCSKCPRYLAQTDTELKAVAELWYKVGWRNTVVSVDEIRCNGCSADKKCTYGLVDCTKAHTVDKCSQCVNFPCETIEDMLCRSEKYKKICRKVCTDDEYKQISEAFFNKFENMTKN